MMSDLYTNWALPFMETFCSAGIKNAVISPGSRSTPLALAALSAETLRCDIVIDERSAAFFALGQIRKTGNPTLLICTSGSAGAHYFPAIVEAALTHLPLIVITADRPWELQQCGANQTSFQQSWYGQHVKAFFELGEPPRTWDTPTQSVTESAAIRIAVQAAHTAMSAARGPVHINARFRKPLEPSQWPLTASPESGPLPRTHPSRQVLSDDAVQLIAQYCQRHAHGVVVCGPGPMDTNDTARQHVISAFATATGYPVLGEIASAIKVGDVPFIKHTSAFFTLSECHLPIPDFILEVHRPLTSGAYENFVKSHPDIPRVVISNDSYVDFTGSAEAVFAGDICDALSRVTALCSGPQDASWMERLKKFDERIDELLDTYFGDSPFTEAIALRRAMAELNKKNTLCIGNSMVIRDADLFSPLPACGTMIHQRGASGIDGLISAAAGTASVTEDGVLAVTGDISALHDLNGFALLKSVSSPLVVLILNNDGGQIFNQLPLANMDALEDTLQRGFVVSGTPSFQGVCEMFNIEWHLVDSGDAIAKSIQTALTKNHTTVIEARIHLSKGYRAKFVDHLANALRERPVS